jgi:alcohol dehydrogenase class IV
MRDIEAPITAPSMAKMAYSSLRSEIKALKKNTLLRLPDTAILVMGEPAEGLPPREASARALDAIRHVIQGVGLPASLKDLKITDTGKIPRWAVEAHKEQRLLSRSPRNLSVEDIQKIYEKAF